MQTQWISCAEGMPREHEPICFQIDGRERSMEGTYTSGVFRSRWSAYDIDRVGSWRVADAGPFDGDSSDALRAGISSGSSHMPRQDRQPFAVFLCALPYGLHGAANIWLKSALRRK